MNVNFGHVKFYVHCIAPSPADHMERFQRYRLTEGNRVTEHVTPFPLAMAVKLASGRDERQIPDVFHGCHIVEYFFADEHRADNHRSFARTGPDDQHAAANEGPEDIARTGLNRLISLDDRVRILNA